jgi:hypothetical protein
VSLTFSLQRLPISTITHWPVPDRGKILSVHALIYYGMHLLIYLFFIGLAGASSVVIISFIEDFRELLSK